MSRHLFVLLSIMPALCLARPDPGSEHATRGASTGALASSVEKGAGDDRRVRVTIRIFARPMDHPATPASVEIDAVDLGQDFVVKVLVEDIRAAGTRQGVFSSFIDVNLDDAALASLVSPLPGVTHPQSGDPTPYLHNVATFGQFAQPQAGDGLIDTDSNGTLDQIDVLGSFRGALSGPGAGEFLLVEFAMTAQSPGRLTITAEPTTEDPALDPEDSGESPIFDTGIYGQDEPLCPSQSFVQCMGTIEFVADSILIGDEVFADGFE